jgi:hypothetical protein
VLIEPDREGVDLPLELAQPAGEPVALLAERPGERHHRLDELVLSVVGVQHVVHRPLRPALRDASKRSAAAPPFGGTRTWRGDGSFA